MLQCIPVPISVPLSASDNGRRAAAGSLLWKGGKRLSPATLGMPFLTKGFFKKLQIKSKQKAPDDRKYSLVSKCAKSFTQRDHESALSVAGGAGYFLEAVKILLLA